MKDVVRLSKDHRERLWRISPNFRDAIEILLRNHENVTTTRVTLSDQDIEKIREIVTISTVTLQSKFEQIIENAKRG